ncbi:MAG: Pr6Pr family membrane protein [Bifidobacterium sp.]|nr:Pr6Pr family membrane protein [Bifidobacterium sp.]
MVRSRTAQLIFQSFYVALGCVGILGSLGLYDAEFSGTFFVYFTNLSNYLCIAVMLFELVQTAKRKGDGYVDLSPAVKFICVTAILLTFFVFNFILAGAADRDPLSNYEVTCIIFHTVLPLMFVADWILFYRHRRVKWTYPLYSMIFPLVYLAFIYLRAWIVGFNPDTPLLYPYFFLDLDQQSVGGVVRWCVILLVAFVALGYILMGIDWSIKSKPADGDAAQVTAKRSAD